MFPSLDRVYVNSQARQGLGWEPTHDFAWALEQLRDDQEPSSDLARTVGKKSYHPPSVGGYAIH